MPDFSWYHDPFDWQRVMESMYKGFGIHSIYDAKRHTLLYPQSLPIAVIEQPRFYGVHILTDQSLICQLVIMCMFSQFMADCAPSGYRLVLFLPRNIRLVDHPSLYSIWKNHTRPILVFFDPAECSRIDLIREMINGLGTDARILCRFTRPGSDRVLAEESAVLNGCTLDVSIYLPNSFHLIPGAPGDPIIHRPDHLKPVFSTIIGQGILSRPVLEWCWYHRKRGVDRIILSIADPGCYPYAIYHALAPFFKEGWLFIVDATDDMTAWQDITTWTGFIPFSTLWTESLSIPDFLRNHQDVHCIHMKPTMKWMQSSPPPDGREQVVYDEMRLDVSIPREQIRHDSPPILVFYHVGAYHEKCRAVFDEQISLLRSSGLYDRALEIHIGVVGQHFDYQTWIAEKKWNKIRVLYQASDPTYHEIKTVMEMRRHLHQSSLHDAYVLYFHTKGTTSCNQFNRNAVISWRHAMQYHLIEKFERCIELIKEHKLDALGGLFLNEFPGTDSRFFLVNPGHACHYSGNFWWSTASHIRRLPELTPHTSTTHPGDHHLYRLQAENWVLSMLPTEMKAGLCFRYSNKHPYDIPISIWESPPDYYEPIIDIGICKNI